MNDLIIDPNNPAGALASAPSTQDLVIDSDTDRFMVDVIEASQSVPVIVDFWSPGCQPCKTLGPALERLVKRAGGLVKMVKINVDENQALAGQLRVQSVPTVFAFKDGRPVDGFTGALADTQIQIFIDRLIGDAKPPIEAAMEQAGALLAESNGAEAEAVYTAVLAQDPSYIPALAGMIRAIAVQGEFERASDIIESLDAKTRANVEIEQAVSALELAQQAANTDTGEIDALTAQVEAEPKNLTARFDLALALFAQGKAEPAIDHLLEVVRLDRTWNDQAGRKQLIKIFDALGAADPVTQDARRRLSAVLFS